jgi:hypothetical protein
MEAPVAKLYAIDELITQIRKASAADLDYLALFGALALPDICGALASDNGQATGPKYKDWVRANVPEQAAQADMLYGLRCSLLHQGKALPHGGAFPVAFTLQQTGGGLHNLSTIVQGDQVGWLHVPTLIDELTRGAEQWITQFGETKTVTRNLEKFARLRPEGLYPHVKGVVIA